MNNLRPALYALLALILFLLWSDWQRANAPAVRPAVTATSVPAAPSTRHAGTPSPSSSVAVAPPSALAPVATGEKVFVKTDTMVATLTTRGGDFTSVLMRHYFADKSHGKRLYPLLRPMDGTQGFVNQSGLLGHSRYPNQNTLYTVAHTHYQLQSGKQHLRLSFHWVHGSVQVTKTYIFTRGSYLVDVHYTVHNLGHQARSVYLYNQFVHVSAPKTKFYDSEPVYIGAAVYTPATKYHQIPFADMTKHPLHEQSAGGWVAISQHYFLGAALPPPETAALFYSEVLPGPRYLVGYKTAHPVIVAPGATETLATRLFLGPKTPALLQAAAPGLRLTVDYGWLTVLAQPLYAVLAHLQGLTGNWGVAIILLTVLIKLIFFPLSATSFKSMARMRKLQPRMAALKKQHGKDKGALQKATMELYKQEKMNPLGGCLPMVVQIPVFIALYWVLLDSVALRDAPFMLWIHNLAAPDPYFVLPILMGVSMVFQQLLNPAVMDPTQRKVMMIMPVVFTIFFLFFPAGLVLYWVVNNILSILQQWWVMARMEKA
ncbi:MAG TPA: membrane protein insertase YidC [Acidiferrobacter sp.]|nr:membrane protein insertase YidC [Acidiferrobacter sp.]